MKDLASHGLALDRQPTTLIIVESNTPTAELLSKNAVLFEEVVDRLPLLTVDPTTEDKQDEVECRWCG